MCLRLSLLRHGLASRGEESANVKATICEGVVLLVLWVLFGTIMSGILSTNINFMGIRFVHKCCDMAVSICQVYIFRVVKFIGNHCTGGNGTCNLHNPLGEDKFEGLVGFII